MGIFDCCSRDNPHDATWEGPALDEYFDNGGQAGDRVRMEGNILTGYRLVKTGHGEPLTPLL